MDSLHDRRRASLRPLGQLLRPGIDVHTRTGRARERDRRAILTAVVSFGTRGVAFLTTMATVRVTLSYLGAEQYGMWMTIASISTFLGFTDLGLGNGTLNAISDAHGRNDRERAARILASGLVGLAAVSGLLVLIFGLGLSAIPWSAVFNVTSPAATAAATPALGAFLVCYLVALPFGLGSQARLAFQEGYVNSLLSMAANILGLGGAIVCVALRLPLPVLVAATSAPPALVGVVNLVSLVGLEQPWLRPARRLVSRRELGALLGVGGLFLVLQICYIAAFATDALVLARLRGPESVAEYDVATRLFLLPTLLTTTITAPLWPAYREALTSGDVGWIVRTLRRTLVISAAISLVSSAILVTFHEPILRVWIGGSVAPTALTVVAAALSSIAMSVATTIAMFLNGAQLLRFQVITMSLMAFVNLGLSIELTRVLGTAGVLFGTSIAVALFLLAPAALYLPGAIRRLTPGGSAA